MLTKVQQANIFFLFLYSIPHLLYVIGFTRQVHVNHSLWGPTQAQDIPSSAGYQTLEVPKLHLLLQQTEDWRWGNVHPSVCHTLLRGTQEICLCYSLQCLPRHESIGKFSWGMHRNNRKHASPLSPLRFDPVSNSPSLGMNYLSGCVLVPRANWFLPGLLHWCWDMCCHVLKCNTRFRLGSEKDPTPPVSLDRQCNVHAF